MGAVIKGYGFSVPEKVITNKDLEKIVDTSDEWISERTGIRARRVAEKGVSNSDVALQASRDALSEAGLSPDDLDGILVGTITADMSFPSTACFLQHKLGATKGFAFDLQAACSGFVYSLDIGRRIIETGGAENLLVLGSEVLSSLVNYEDRNTCILFGDGAGAVILGKGDEGDGVISSKVHSDGSLWELLYAAGWGTANRMRGGTSGNNFGYIEMQGNETFKQAVHKLVDVSREVMDDAGISIDDVDLFIPHQANRRIIEAVGKRIGIPEEKVYMNLSRYGNTSAASIPIAMAEARREGVLKDGDTLLISAFGGGLTWGAAIIKV